MTLGELEDKLANLTPDEKADVDAISSAARMMSFGLQMKLAGAKQGESERASLAAKASWESGSRGDGFGDGPKKLNRDEIIRRARGMLNALDDPRGIASALEKAGLGSARHIRRILQDEDVIPTRKRT